MRKQLRSIIEKEFNPRNSAFADSKAMKLADSLEGFYDEEFEKQASEELKSMRDNVSKEFIAIYNSHSSLDDISKKISDIWKKVEEEDIDF